MKSKITYKNITTLKIIMFKNKTIRKVVISLIALVVLVLLMPLAGSAFDRVKEVLPEEVTEAIEEVQVGEDEMTEEVVEDSEEVVEEEETEEVVEEVVEEETVEEEVDTMTIDERVAALEKLYNDYEALLPDSTWYTSDALGRIVNVTTTLPNGTVVNCFDYFQDQLPMECQYDGLVVPEEYMLMDVVPTKVNFSIKAVNTLGVTPLVEAATAPAITTETVKANCDSDTQWYSEDYTYCIDKPMTEPSKEETTPSKEEVVEMPSQPAIEAELVTEATPAPAEEVVESETDPISEITIKLEDDGWYVGDTYGSKLIVAVKDLYTVECDGGFCLVFYSKPGASQPEVTSYTLEEFLNR